MKLFPYQLEGVHHLLNHRKCQLWDEPGLGKTCQALTALQSLECPPAIIFCPAYLRRNWAKEVGFWTLYQKIHVCEKANQLIYPADGEITIASWGQIPEFENEDMKEFAQFNADKYVLVVDEVHSLKNRTAKRTKKYKRFSEITNPLHEWGLTGTPLTNDPLSVWGTLDSQGLANQSFKSEGSSAWNRFIWCFGGKKNKYFGGYTWGDEPRLETYSHLSRFSKRRFKSQVAKQLPRKTRVELICYDLSPSTVNVLDEEWRDYTNLVLHGKERLPHISRYSRCMVALNECKLKTALSWVSDMEGTPIVVASYNLHAIEYLHKKIKNSRKIVGGVSPSKREQIVDDFQAGKFDVLVGTIGAMGVGINLFRASNMLIIHPAWNPAENIQMEDRLHRHGQHYPVTITYIVADHELDYRLHEKLVWKKKLIDIAVDGK